MPGRVFVTGIGAICAAGKDTEELRHSLKSLQTGIGKIRNLNTHLNYLPFAEVNFSNDELTEIAHVSGRIYSRTALLGIIAAREAVGNLQFTIYDLQFKYKVRTGLISATTVGGMTLNEVYYKELLQNDRHKDLVESFDIADCAERIADILGIHDYVSTISTACLLSANAIMNGARMIKNNRLDRVIAGGNDALSHFTIKGFSALEILSKEPCKPFDAGRNGLTLGEGAAYLVLEAEEIANPDNIICEVKGYGNANDAYNITASSPEGNGSYLSMMKALMTSGLNPEDINYINAHGTGTVINDLSEGNAVMKLFGDKIPPISSTKGFTGHTLAAAGAIEGVISCLSIKHGFIPANLNFKNKMDELSFAPVTEFVNNYPVKNVLSNSFGFGGNNTSLVFSKSVDSC